MAEPFVLSASSVSTYLRCGHQWLLAYVVAVKSPPSLKAVRGIAVHRAVEHNMVQKINSTTDLPLDEVLDAYDTSWNDETADGFNPIEGDASPGEIKDAGVKLVRIYQREVAPKIQPDIVEEPVRFKINGRDFCVTLDTPVLTQDLRWVPAGDLIVGDPVVGFEEGYPGPGYRRRLEPSSVTSAKPILAPVYSIYLRNGPTLKATGEHRWLVRNGMNNSRWVRTDRLEALINHGLRKLPLTMPNFASHVPATRRTSYAAGFLAAAFDSEGHLSWRNGDRHDLGAIGFSQNNNELLAAVSSMLDEEGLTHRIERQSHGDVRTIFLHGGRKTTERFLAEYRPPRLLARYAERVSRLRMTATEDYDIERVEFSGEQEIAAISTSSQTYLAAGFGAHNTGQIDLGQMIPINLHGEPEYAMEIRDTKTTGRRPDPSAYLLNMTGYAISSRQATGQPEADTVFDYLVATQKPYYHELRLGGPVSDNDIRRFSKIVGSVSDGIEKGNFAPNGLQTGACRWCGFTAICPYYKEVS